MVAVVLVIIGVVVWLWCADNSKSRQTPTHHRNKADKEAEEIFFSGASGDDIDDF